jgi:hypothetical protein
VEDDVVFEFVFPDDGLEAEAIGVTSRAQLVGVCSPTTANPRARYCCISRLADPRPVACFRRTLPADIRRSEGSENISG